MKTIHKQVLALDGSAQTVELPKGSKILCVQLQNGNKPCVWYEFSKTQSQVEDATFKWHGTGHDIPNNPGVYVGTVQFDVYVFHLYRK